ncbi:hypothetical protein K431DRAFT_342957 [Polychaeton citri CBS 116435]|uniref:DUF7371 domain-containing protein n=1 Tax=Polychaeton citri CBS 116435 TaxID=1314669 RepID=A0A9P4QH78_9PEZI|nr:hypothetical protein K431DRAFT_342957 [Polychaeton citri CBS 116435]
MFYSTIALTALMSLASAAPSSVLAAPPQFGFQESAKFDDLSALPAAVTAVGSYSHLYYQGFNVVSQGITDTQLVGVKAQSPSNVAAVDPLSETFQGQASLLTDYDDSNTTSFDLQSFYFGCVLAEANSITSTPQTCSLTITGFAGQNNAVATQSAQFTSSGTLQQMKKVTLKSSFKKLTSVTFDLSSTTTALVTDDFSYVYYTKDGKAH